MAYSEYDEDHLNHVRAEEARRLNAAHELLKSASLTRQEVGRSACEQRSTLQTEQAVVEASIEEIIKAKHQQATEPQNEIDQLRIDRPARPACEDRRDPAAENAIEERSAEGRRMEAEFARRIGKPSTLDRMTASVETYRAERARREERRKFLRGGGLT